MRTDKILPRYVFIAHFDRAPLQQLARQYRIHGEIPARNEVLRRLGLDLAKIPAEFGYRLCQATDAEFAASARNSAASLIELEQHLPVQEREILLKVLHASIAGHHSATAQHELRVAKLCRWLGAAIGLPANSRTRLFQAGYLHDVGKIIVPAANLDRAGSLDPNESDLIRRGHLIFGYYLLTQFTASREAAKIIGFNHIFDGNTPEGFSFANITVEGQILSLVDYFDAITEPRKYRTEHYTTKQALTFIKERERDGFRYDRPLVAAFEQLLKNGV
ncbi:MAG: HD domain-containing phosphohydrolase [Candidatus Margulisiibacteriota bacterium]|jgi:HD-GYP domain-containing protein (c-di-GMP phosphodiesterase class II)